MKEIKNYLNCKKDIFRKEKVKKKKIPMVEVRGSKSENFYIREKKKNDGTLWKKKY